MRAASGPAPPSPCPGAFALKGASVNATERTPTVEDRLEQVTAALVEVAKVLREVNDRLAALTGTAPRRPALTVIGRDRSET
jgi:hypothetical protein